MLGIVIDMAIVWFLLNVFSEDDWDDQKLKIFGIVIAISILGGVLATVVAEYVGVFPSLAAYFLVGTICLWGLASLEWRKAFAAMGIFTAIKVVFVIVALFFLSGQE